MAQDLPKQVDEGTISPLTWIMDDPLEYIHSRAYPIDRRALSEEYPEIYLQLVLALENAIREAEAQRPRASELLRLPVFTFRLAAASAANAQEVGNPHGHKGGVTYELQ